MKGLMKVSYGGSDVWRRWRGIGTPRVYVGECAGSHSLGRPRRRWIDTVKEWLMKRRLDGRQATRMVQDRSEWRGFARGSSWGIARGVNP